MRTKVRKWAFIHYCDYSRTGGLLNLYIVELLKSLGFFEGTLPKIVHVQVERSLSGSSNLQIGILFTSDGRKENGNSGLHFIYMSISISKRYSRALIGLCKAVRCSFGIGPRRCQKMFSFQVQLL